MDTDRPIYSKWRRHLGGYKQCPACGYQHASAIRIDGRTRRPKHCIKCGTPLPKQLAYPRKKVVRWYVREFDPKTGKSRDSLCASSEAADEFIRQKQRDYTADPVQARLLEDISSSCRNVKDPIRADLIRRACARSLETTAADVEGAVDELIRLLGGDPLRRTIVRIGWDEAVQLICKDNMDSGQSLDYINDLKRVARYLAAITGLQRWSDLTLESVTNYRRARMEGGWLLGDTKMPSVNGRAVNKDLSTLSAFLTRAAKKHWVTRNVLLEEQAEDLWVRERQTRVPYMPDEVLKAVIDAALDITTKVLFILAYYTGSRRPDLLALEWDRDLDLDGALIDDDGLVGPKIWIEGNKADTPHWMPLHAAAVAALRTLKLEPVIDAKVFPFKGITDKRGCISKLWRKSIDSAVGTLPERLRRPPLGARWLLKHLRKKANTDYKRLGASAKERMAFLGHRSEDINERHYEGLEPTRLRRLVDGMASFGLTG